MMVDASRLFQVVEIEVSSRCNRKCHYCPQSFDWYRKPQTLMNEEMFENIIDQLAALDFSGRISFHHYNEPLLRNDLEVFVSKTRSALRNAWLVLYTNGDLLNEKRYGSLLEVGVDLFLVTRHSGSPIDDRPFQKVIYPGEFVLSNRGGLMANSSELGLACYAPTEMLIIRHDGKVVLCHEDAGAQRIFGDVSNQSLLDIWFCNKFTEIRGLLEKGRRLEAGTPCATCDNRLHPLPDTTI